MKNNGSRFPEALCEKGVLNHFVKFTEKHLCQSLCEICEINQNTFLYRTPLVVSGGSANHTFLI